MHTCSCGQTYHSRQGVISCAEHHPRGRYPVNADGSRKAAIPINEYDAILGERDRLREVNKELLAALEALTDRIQTFNGQTACSPEFASARAALAKAGAA